MPGQHALLSPSAAHRWMNCTAAPLLERDEKDVSSDYAEEGTLAHAYCAFKLKHFLHLPHDEEEREIAELEAKYHTGEMDEYTDTYKSIVLEKYNAAKSKTKDAQLLVETRLDFSNYIPEAFGTSDAIIIADGIMEVIDFKYGKGVKVSAEYNPQMMIYALGAYEMFNFSYKIEHVRMTIVQPRIDNLSEYDISVPHLLNWATSSLLPKAQEAFSGNGKQHPGEWCKFCKVKAKCAALANSCMSVQAKHPDTSKLSKEAMEKDILPRLQTIRTWLSAVEEYAQEQALSGVQYEGFKLVEGRSIRKITDAEAVMQLFKNAGFARESYIKPTELRGISDLEKMMGKKAFAEMCADYLIKPKGKPTLVPSSDKRPAINTAADDFKNIN